MNKAASSRAELPANLQRALDLAIAAKGVGPVILHLTEVAGYTDHALIISGRSDRHVGGITDAIVSGLKAQGVAPIGSDGLDEHLWDLIDYDDFLVHVFYHPVRKHYDLESMWIDAPRIELDLPSDVMDTSGLEELAPPDPMPAFRGGSFGAFEGELDNEEDPDLVGITGPGELSADAEVIPDEEDYDDDDADDLDEFEDDGDEFDDDDALDGGDELDPAADAGDAASPAAPAPGPARRK
ncbi:MAG TPA: ribosome silencing factor [Nannocystis sp.]